MVYTSAYNSLKSSNCIVFLSIILVVLIGYVLIPYSSLFSHIVVKSSNFSIILNKITSPTRVLVVYVYAETHTLSEENLRLFIRLAVRNTHDADYYFILQQLHNETVDETTLPILPSNAHYIQHENKCYDMGTVGWFLSLDIINKNKYRYFIFLNSSVRGPFIVSYYDNLSWYTIFTRRLIDHIKLVGCTINCENAPHVQSYLWALDLQGLNLLLNNGTAFACYGSKNEAINKAEIGASQIILKSGFGIDSLMKKHQGIDFREEKNNKCNNVKIPTSNRNVDGITLDPFEVVFVKIKGDMAEYRDNRQRVAAYEKWIH
jgi:hypothetical protein